MTRIDTAQVTRPFEGVFRESLAEARGALQIVLLSFSAPETLQEMTRELRAGGMKWIIFKERDGRMRFSDRRGLSVCEVD